MELAQPIEAPSNLGSYLDDWLAHVAGRVRAKTWQGYECLIRLYARPHLGNFLLTELSPLHLQRLYASLLSDPERPLSGGSVLNLNLVLTQALSQAVRWGYLSANPAAGAQPPRPRRAEPFAVDARLCEKLLEATKIPWSEIRRGVWEARFVCGVQYHHDPVTDDRVRLNPLDPKTSRHAGQCEFNGVTDPAMLRAVLRVTRKDGYDWVECNGCDIGWQVAHFAESAQGVG